MSHSINKRTMPAVLITGNPGSGKSTLMARLIQDVGARRIAGLSTPEIRRGNVRTGFKMIDLASGEEEMLASTSGSGPSVGKYHVNLEGIDRMVAKVELSLDAAQFVFIDEIGKMELFSKRFKAFVDHAFSLDTPIVAVVHRKFVSVYRSKGRLFSLTRDNFEEIRWSILAEFQSARQH
jgi:nucleoside-triphosphatase THEP1